MLSRTKESSDNASLTAEGAGAPKGGSTSERLVAKLSGVLPKSKSTRRSFLTRTAVVGSALAVNPFDFMLKPVSAYDAVCGSGNTCGEGWSVFCCTINNGQNSCPPGSFLAGWWKADNSSFCGGTARYYLDCNATCPTSCSCYCPTGTCDNRRTCCNQFRYGQCHQEIACAGPVVCRVISCVPPWQVDSACTTASATDNRTADHNAPCNTNGPPSLTNLEPSMLVQHPDGHFELFDVSGGALVQNWQAGTVWSGWRTLDRSRTYIKVRGALTGHDGNIVVIVAATDGDWQFYFDQPSHSWHGPGPL